MTKEEIGLVIKRCRVNADLTQAQVAARIGRPQQTIANWEIGRSQPDANTLFELFSILGVSVDEAFGFQPQKGTGRIVADLSEAEESLILNYRRLSTAGKEYILQTMAMAVRSYSEKNNASSGLEKAN